MSMTRSRGQFGFSKYSTPALAVAEWLRCGRENSNDTVNGALLAIHQFFDLVIAGYGDDRSDWRTFTPRLSALFVFDGTYREMNSLSKRQSLPPQKVMEEIAKAYHRTVDGLLSSRTGLVGQDLHGLQVFLFSLNRLGEREKSARIDF
jgi:hypothetical protein